VAAFAAKVDIRQRINHAGVRSNLIGRLVVPTMAQVAKIAKSVLGVPDGSVSINKKLGLGFVAVLAGRSLRTALGFGRRGGHQENAAGNKQNADRNDNKSDSFLIHIILWV
jgi:hypothetical protein